MTLQAVFFDMGGTIDTFRFTRDYRISKASLIRDCLTRAGIQLNCSDGQLADMITNGAAAYLKWNLETRIELPPSEIWSRYFLKNMHISADALKPVAEDLAFLYETQLYIREMHAGVPQVLEKIKSLGLKIGCISNTQSRQQVPYNLKQYGIIDYFDPIIISSVYGRRKPDPTIFYYAARMANVPTGSCIYIGDKISRDILGASRSGFRMAIQIRHEYDNGEKDEGATPDAFIENISALIPIIEEELAKDRKQIGSVNDRSVKAIFFDAGDILYHRPHRDENLKNFLNGKKLNPHPDFDRERLRYKDLAFSGKIRRHEYYEKVLLLYGFTDPEEIQAGIAAMNLDDNTVEIIEGVPETIRELKNRGYILGIITDTAFSYTKKLNWFDEHDFGRCWDIMISSKEIGVRKPSPIMYKMAIEQAGVRPAEAIFVGHKKTELDGARAIGLKTIAFNYEKIATADFYVEKFSDLVKLPILQVS